MGMQKRNLRVLHVYRTYFPDPPGGLQEAIRQICLSTKDFGIESRVYTLSPNPNADKIVSNEAEIFQSKSWWAPASCDLGGRQAFQKFRELSDWADIVHYHFPWPFADLLNLTAETGKPLVMTYHSDIVRQRFLSMLYSPLMKHTFRSMSAIVATSPTYARTSSVLTKHAPVDRLRTIPLGICDYSQDDGDEVGCVDILSKLELEGQPFVLALGVLRYYKGLHTLIEAAQQIQGKIVIAGAGPEAERLKSQAKSLNTSNVVFAGMVSVSEKVALLKHCRALALPSHVRSEAFGMVLVEASMFSKPMVCCEVGSGTSYVNVDGETGFVVPPESPDAFAAACNRLLLNETIAIKMGKSARQRYENLFSGPALGAAYSALYGSVAA